MLHEVEYAVSVLTVAFSHTGDALLVLAGLAVALVVGEIIFKRVRPHDFREVPIVRRCASLAGMCFALSALITGAVAARSLPVNLLAPFGEQAPDFTLFVDVLGRVIVSLDPHRAMQAARVPQLLYGLGVLLAMIAALFAVFFWRRQGQFKAFLTALLTVMFTAVAIIYSLVALIWLLQLLNIWFIAVAGLLFQKYRNLQFGHGRSA